LNNKRLRNEIKRRSVVFLVYYFERNQSDACLFNVGGLKFLFAAAGFFRLHWREIFRGPQRDD